MDINTLVQGFARNIRQLKAPEYKESQLRLQYLDRFWSLLGWDVTNDEQRAPQDVEVVVEPSMDSVEDDGLRAREPDYLFRVSGFSRFIVEAKKPAVDIETDKKAIFQTKRYAWSATIPFAILTDFEQFRLYDTTLKPILNEPSRGLIKDYVVDFGDYPSKWEEIVATFGRDAVAEGSLERLRAKIRKLSAGRRVRTVDRMLYELRGDEPVDRVFLEYLERYRKQFAQVIYHDNKKDFPEADSVAIVPHDESRMHYLAGLLNSQLIEKHLRQTGTKFRGGYLNCEIRFIKDLPIKLPTTPAEEKLAERVVESVRAITGAKVKLQGASLSDRDRTSLESEVESHEQRINEAVLRLYGVKELPA